MYFDLASNTNYEGIAAYWKAYIEVRVGLIIESYNAFYFFNRAFFT